MGTKISRGGRARVRSLLVHGRNSFQTHKSEEGKRSTLGEKTQNWGERLEKVCGSNSSANVGENGEEEKTLKGNAQYGERKIRGIGGTPRAHLQESTRHDFGRGRVLKEVSGGCSE